jgi:hypothetical protein
MVSGAEAVQAAVMGTFTKVANLTQGDRPVYKRVTAAPTAPPVIYLFYWPSTSEWLIGSNHTSTSNISVQSAGIAALCPEQVPEIGWEVYNGSAWVSTYPIQFVRTGDTPAAAPPFAAWAQKLRKTTTRHCTPVSRKLAGFRALSRSIRYSGLLSQYSRVDHRATEGLSRCTRGAALAVP